MRGIGFLCTFASDSWGSSFIKIKTKIVTNFGYFLGRVGRLGL